MELEGGRILFYDIETSPNLGWSWEKFQQDIIAFEKEREVICFAYKWLGDKKVKSYFKGYDLPKKKFIKKIHSLFNKADAICGHNARKFDIKMSNTAFIESGLAPPSPYKVIDTREIAYYKFRWNSNKLDDLARRLGLGRKIDTGGFNLWLDVMKGNKKAIRKMKRYNEQDVILLEKVYFKLRSWGKHPDAGKGFVCPTCLSPNVKWQGWRHNRVYKVRQFQCKNCGRWGTSNKKIKYNYKEYLKSV